MASEGGRFAYPIPATIATGAYAIFNLGQDDWQDFPDGWFPEWTLTPGGAACDSQRAAEVLEHNLNDGVVVGSALMPEPGRDGEAALWCVGPDGRPSGVGDGFSDPITVDGQPAAAFTIDVNEHAPGSYLVAECSTYLVSADDGF
ncbi:hypothetical protein DVS28_b0410 (plasmid) [Euzebya pacifica]|uniref:Uncharacterized protein n=1 Tax=Euzebya pacifica TaxID=1608957 RepID=A0A346Y6R6_9ACTN|nr:hypothetical protein DVS28_b0410 [Euzebya pacifica]